MNKNLLDRYTKGVISQRYECLYPCSGFEEAKGQNGGQSADDAEAIDALTLTKQDFLVSFMVDARGGSMKGCRYSGVKVSFRLNSYRRS